MKKIILISAVVISFMANAQLNNRRLVVPEYANSRIKTYVPSGSGMVADPSYTIEFNNLTIGIAANSKPNCVAMNGSDLYVATSFINPTIYKFPNYGNNPQAAILGVSQINFSFLDNVGIAFDASGNLYVAEGSFANNNIVKYSGPNLAFKTDLTLGGTPSYFSNITFDASGNLWASDYYNNRIIAIKAADLNTFNAPIKAFTNSSGAAGFTGSSIATTGVLNNTIINYVFTSPEGVAFDSAGALWVANNNDTGSLGNLSNDRTTMVKINPNVISILLNSAPQNQSLNFFVSNASTTGCQIYVMPDSTFGKPQLGGMQIDKATNRIYVNEQISNSGLFFDTATIAGITNNFTTYQLPITSTNPGNGGIYLATNAQILSVKDIEQAENNVAIYPNPSTGNFKINGNQTIKAVTGFDVLGKEIKIELNDTNYSIENAQSGVYYIKITNKNGGQNTKKIIIE